MFVVIVDLIDQLKVKLSVDRTLITQNAVIFHHTFNFMKLIHRIIQYFL